MRVDGPNLVRATPDWFAGAACPFDFDPFAKCPKWLDTLRQCLEDDAESIDLLQEWMGLNMVPDLRYESFMTLAGLPGGGKGTVLSMLSNLLGEHQVAVTSFRKMATRFGLQTMLGRLAAVLPDAHVDERTDAVAALEVLKSITGGDPQWAAKEQLFSAWKAYAETQGVKAGHQNSFGGKLVAAVPAVRIDERRGPKGEQFAVYGGIRLMTD